MQTTNPLITSYFATPKEKLIIALDGIETLREAHALVESTREYTGWYKIGLETITAFSTRDMIGLVKSYEARVFTDGKYHDIPNTISGTASKLKRHHTDMFNMHCSNGTAAMKAAVEKKGDSIIIGVTVLTSLSEEECRHIYGTGVDETVLRFTKDAQMAGLDGIVCSARELEMLSHYPELRSLLKITPAIQFKSMSKNDQKRTMTAREAIQFGATGLVVGRAITQAENPGEAARMILEEITEAMNAAV